jgi:hypothetical protein
MPNHGDVVGNYIYVIADRIDDVKVVVKCPFCWSNYKKDGQPYKNAKRVEHFHGSDRSTIRREIKRVPHCRVATPGNREFLIAITDATKGSTI